MSTSSAYAVKQEFPNISGTMLTEVRGDSILEDNSTDPNFQKASELIDSAVEMVINDAKHTTIDIGGSSSTQIMGNAIYEMLEKNL